MNFFCSCEMRQDMQALRIIGNEYVVFLDEQREKEIVERKKNRKYSIITYH